MSEDFFGDKSPGQQAGGMGFEFDDDDDGVYDTLDMIIYEIDPPPTNVVFTDHYEFVTDKDSGKKMLGEFEVQTEIGDGSFSHVKKLKSTKYDLEFALKVYNKLYLQGQRTIDYETGAWINLLVRAEREVRVWMNLDHPNVAKLFEVYEEVGKQYMYLRAEIGHLGQVSDFDPKTRKISLNSEMLKAYKEQKQLEDRVAIIKDLFRQMLEGITYMIGAGYSHRDIKLENLVVNKTLKAMWIDFNSAKPYTPETKYTDYEGTLHYAAPECIYSLNEGYDPVKAEVWSLGVCLYGLYFGFLPFDLPRTDDNEYGYEMDMNMKIRDDPLKIEGDCPADLKTLLETMLQKDPVKRPTLQEIKTSSFLA